jgi:DNA end-binding protein Ku
VATDEGRSSRGNVVNLMDALQENVGDEAQVGEAEKKPVASAKSDTKKGIGLVKTPTKSASKRRAV